MIINTVKLLLLVLLITSCGSNGKRDKDDSGWIEDTTLYNTSGDGSETGLSRKEEDFVNDVLSMNAEDMLWLQNGISFGTDEGLKMHAKKMLEDHRKLDSLFKRLASDRKLPLEDIDSSKEYYLDEKIGNDWNEEWADAIKERHGRLIRKFERVEKSADDSTLKAIIKKELPLLRTHRNIAEQLEDQFDGIQGKK